MIGSLEQMVQDMKAGITDYTIRGSCSSCGECCSDLLPISDGEIQRIREYMEENGIKEQLHLPVATSVIDFKCPFRSDSKKKCVIYKVRPRICREFRCDKPRKGEWSERNKYSKDTQVTSMRATFFGRG